MSKPQVFKSTSFQGWRRKHAITFGTETLWMLDHLIQEFDWKKLLDIELPPNSEAAITKTFVNARLKDKYAVGNSEIKARVINNITYIAFTAMNAARIHAAAQEHTRIMPEHVEATFPTVVAILSAYEWKGVEDPTRKRKTPDPPAKKRGKKTAVTESIVAGCVGCFKSLDKCTCPKPCTACKTVDDCFCGSNE